MNIKEYLDLMEWYQEEVTKKNIITTYQQIFNMFVSNNKPNTQKQSPQPHISKLNEILKTMNYEKLNLLQRIKLDDLKVGNYLGEKGIKFVEKKLSTFAYDTTELQRIFQEIHTELNLFNTDIVTLIPIVKKHITNEQITEIQNNQLRVAFKNEMSISNVNELALKTKNLNVMFKGIVEVYDKKTIDIQLNSVQNGSVIFDFFIENWDVLVLSSVILERLLKHITQIATTKKAINEVKKSQLDLDTADLDNQIKEKQKKYISEMLDELVEEYKVIPEKIAGLNISIKQINKFIQKGGTLDFYNVEDESEDEKITKLIENTKKIRDYYKEEELLLGYVDIEDDVTEAEDKKEIKKETKKDN